MKPNKELEHLKDAVIAQEMALSLLINAMIKTHPEIIAPYLEGLNHVLDKSPIPTDGARRNLSLMRDSVAASLPRTNIGH